MVGVLLCPVPLFFDHFFNLFTEAVKACLIEAKLLWQHFLLGCFRATGGCLALGTKCTSLMFFCTTMWQAAKFALSPVKLIRAGTPSLAPWQAYVFL
jgi:hypothetical protein